MKTNVKGINLKKTTLSGLFALFGALMVFLIPELASAADTAATEAMNEGFDIGKLLMKALVYIIMAAMFVGFMYALLMSFLDWKSESKRDATAGGILVTLVLGLMVMGVVFVIGEKAIKYIDDNVKITAGIEQLQPDIQVAALSTSVTSNTSV